jgi:curved DNA-binding protein
MSHYNTLGVDKTADESTIKKAYKKLASQHHPDKPGGDTKKFQEIQAAYEILGDAQKKSQYDMQQAGGGHHFQFNTGNMGGMGPNDFNMNDIFAQMRGFGPHGPFKQHQLKNRDVKIAVSLTLFETLADFTKTLNINIPGSNSELVELKISRGIHNGASVKYPGLGGKEYANLPRGDLYVDFIVTPHPYFEQQGIDLHRTISISCFDAILGCTVEVTTIDFKVLELKIPPGTQNNTKFGIPNSGVWAYGTEQRGKLIVNIDIEIPKYLTEAQLTSVKQLQEELAK